MSNTNKIMNTKPHSFNKQWFIGRLQAIKISQRTLAKMIDLDPSAVTLMLSGRRKITTGEVHKIASIFNVSVAEVMRHAGIDVTDDVRKVKIKGFIGEKSRVTFSNDKTLETVIAPADVPADSFCLQVRQPGASQDGWLVFVSGEKTTGQNVIDRPALVQLTEQEHLTCLVRRGYKANTVNIYPLNATADPLENQVIAWASPVLWIRPL
jgi:transcriptional regulator with XRE-family HTH domain